MATDQPIQPKPEPDYAPDEAALMLTEMQMKHLIELRGIALDVARDIASSGGDARQRGAAIAKVGKLILQICAMEQQTIGLREAQRTKLKGARIQAKKEQVKREVTAAIVAASSGTQGAAGIRLRQENLLRDIFMRYDFSDPRTVAAMAADICRQLGVPQRPEVWPAGAEPVAAEAPIGETAPAEVFKPAVKPGASPGARRFDGGGVSANALMAQVSKPAQIKNGRDPP